MAKLVATSAAVAATFATLAGCAPADHHAHHLGKGDPTAAVEAAPSSLTTGARSSARRKADWPLLCRLPRR